MYFWIRFFVNLYNLWFRTWSSSHHVWAWVKPWVLSIPWISCVPLLWMKPPAIIPKYFPPEKGTPGPRPAKLTYKLQLSPDSYLEFEYEIRITWGCLSRMTMQKIFDATVFGNCLFSQADTEHGRHPWESLLLLTRKEAFCTDSSLLH